MLYVLIFLLRTRQTQGSFAKGFSNQLFIIQNSHMQALRQLNSSNCKSTTKMLVNRSRSGTRGALNSRQSQVKEGFTSFRNSLGLKNYHQEQKKKTEAQAFKNEDIYELRTTQCHNQKAPTVSGHAATNNIIRPKPEQKQQIKAGISRESEQKTAETSKISMAPSSKLAINQSEYFIRAYISPTFKIKTLQKQKEIQKKKSEENLLKILKTQEVIQKNRSQYKRQIQLYQKIIQKLKGKKNPEVWQKNTASFLKNSGSMETEAGQSSNEL